MSRTSFKIYCMEFYADHLQKPSPDVYRMFCESGLLDMLDSDYEDLHGMSIEYLLQFFDEFLEGRE